MKGKFPSPCHPWISGRLTVIQNSTRRDMYLEKRIPCGFLFYEKGVSELVCRDHGGSRTSLFKAEAYASRRGLKAALAGSCTAATRTCPKPRWSHIRHHHDVERRRLSRFHKRITNRDTTRPRTTRVSYLPHHRNRRTGYHGPVRSEPVARACARIAAWQANNGWCWSLLPRG